MKKLAQMFLGLVASIGLWACTALGDDVSIRIAGWNLESGESDTAVIKQQIADKKGIHIWGLCEVKSVQDLEECRKGAEVGENTSFAKVAGTTGGQDLMGILFDTNRFELKSTEELKDIQLRDALRAPLVAHFKGKRTGQEFLFMVNHLKRGGANNPDRRTQATMLNAWGKKQTLPVIAVGDYNFDVDVNHADTTHDVGFDEITKDGVFKWLRPKTLLKTNADDDFNTVLDFVFVVNQPSNWFGESRILERDGDTLAQVNDFGDDNRQSDHRPVDALLTLPDGPAPSPGPSPISRAEILKRIDSLESELKKLRRMLRNAN